MFQAFYTGLSGMFSFSKNLDTVSNNIANMNTPGYRGADSFYNSLTNGESLSNGGSGFGTQISGLGYRFSAGDIRQTGNATDVALAGQGMFVLRHEDQLFYTRAGQFEFNDEGTLVDSVSGYEVAQIDDSGQITSLNIDNYRVLAPEATTTIDMTGNLSTDDNEHTVAGVTVFNGLGEESTVDIKFTDNSAVLAGSWLVEVKNADGTVLANGEVRFDVDGTPLTNFNNVSFSVADSFGGTSTISINMGAPGEFSGSTSTSAGSNSSLTGQAKDGFAVSALSQANFDADGTVSFTYANGETRKGPQLAIAKFQNDSVLELHKGSIFSSKNDSARELGRAGDNGLGQVVAESIELSNVDLSKEFADMIIIQRGYQASSRVLNVANQMLEQLYESTRGR